MIARALVSAALLLALTGCTTSTLRSLAVDGRALHASLVTRTPEDAAQLHLKPVLRSNPQLSTDSAFVDVITRMSSQGRLTSEQGVREALYAIHHADEDLGLYGLETASAADADRIEGVLRDIWSHNESLGRTRVHRAGRVFVVVWHNGVSSECWEAVNEQVVKRIGTR